MMEFSITNNYIRLIIRVPQSNGKEKFLMYCAALIAFKRGLYKTRTLGNVNLDYPFQCGYTMCPQSLKSTSKNKDYIR